MITYQIVKRSDHRPAENIGRPYKSKARARNRCDKLDNIHGSYVHFIEPICDHNLSPEMIAAHNVTACDICYVPAVCSWFLLCDNPAVTTEPHPILGDVPICQRCSDKVQRLGSAS